MKLFLSDLLSTVLSVKKFKEHSNIQKAYSILVFLFLIALLPVPYEFYSLLRLIVCGCLIAYLPLAFNRGWFCKCTISGFLILYNPILPIHLGEQVFWTVLNVGTLYFVYLLKVDADTNTE